MRHNTYNTIVDFGEFVGHAKETAKCCQEHVLNYTGDIMTNHSPVFSIVRVTVALALTLILCARSGVSITLCNRFTY